MGRGCYGFARAAGLDALAFSQLNNLPACARPAASQRGEHPACCGTDGPVSEWACSPTMAEAATDTWLGRRLGC